MKIRPLSGAAILAMRGIWSIPEKREISTKIFPFWRDNSVNLFSLFFLFLSLPKAMRMPPMRRDLDMAMAEPTIEVIAPANIRDSVAVPLPDETEDERKRRDDVFFAVLDAGGY